MNWIFISLFVLAANTNALEQVRERFRLYSKFQVIFEQKVEDSFVEGSAGGYLEFSRPHHMKWVYTHPKEEKKEIVFDGKNIKLTREGEKPEVIPQNSSISLEESFAFLWGQTNSQLFNVKNLNEEEFILTPKEPEKARFKSIHVKVEQGVVKEAIVTDLLDGRNRISFRDWRFESKVN